MAGGLASGIQESELNPEFVTTAIYNKNTNKFTAVIGDKNKYHGFTLNPPNKPIPETRQQQNNNSDQTLVDNFEQQQKEGEQQQKEDEQQQKEDEQQQKEDELQQKEDTRQKQLYERYKEAQDEAAANFAKQHSQLNRNRINSENKVEIEKYNRKKG